MTSNEEMLAFYYAIGKAITQWAYVEFALSWIITDCFVLRERSTITAAFKSIDNFRAKLQFAKTIIEAQKLSPKNKAAWAALYDRANKLSKKRNKLAHHWALTELEARAGRRKMLMPMRDEPKGRGAKHPGAIYIRDIEGYSQDFSALSYSLENFGCCLSGQPERFPKSLTQPKRPPTIAQIRREIHAYVQPPQ